MTEDGEDVLIDPVPFQHDLGLQFDASDVKVAAFTSKGAGKTKGVNRSKSMRAPTKGELTGSSKEPISLELFMESVNPLPSWYKGPVDRRQAEEELTKRNLGHGRFLVREKKRAPNKIELALSVTFERAFYHHLLARKVSGSWSVDGHEIDYNDSLEEVIRMFQKKKSTFLAGKLEADGTPVSSVFHFFTR